MEKYSQFRDKGTAIAPFLPVPTPASSVIWTPVYVILFLVRLPAVLFLSVLYFGLLEWVPVGSWVRKCVLGALLAVPGVWWVDLQVDGVKRGNLARSQDHYPAEGTIIASSFTSPLDPLYLAGIFCPIFTRSYPGTRKVEQITLFRAILLAFTQPALATSNANNLVTLKEIHDKNPNSIICVFPECTTTNGRGILPFSPSLLTADPKTKIFPVNLRYTPPDVVTPIPGNMIAWVYKLLHKPTHCMRVRIAGFVYNNPKQLDSIYGAMSTGTDVEWKTNISDDANQRNGDTETSNAVSADEQKVLDRVGEDLARLGRVKRVGLGVHEKIEFVKIWKSRKR